MEYTKYDEMKVVEGMITSYANGKSLDYQNELFQLREIANKLGDKIIKHNDDADRIATWANFLKSTQNDYDSAMSVLSELKKATMTYEQAYTFENIKNGIPEKKALEGNKIFRIIKTQNAEYKRIIDEIALGEKVSPMIEDMGMDADAQIDLLEKKCDEGKITKEELIYYTYVCQALVKNEEYKQFVSLYKSKPQEKPQVMENIENNMR